MLAVIFGLLGLALAAGMSDWSLSKSASAALGALVGIAGGWGQ